MANYSSAYTGSQVDAAVASAQTAQQPPVEGAFVNGDKTKLDATATLAQTAQQPPTEGAFVDGDKTKLDGLNDLVKSDVTGVTGADVITNMVSLTTAEYAAITPDAATLYIIKDV